ncbi:MAG: S24/S26 family peptidase [Bacillota bacterium]|nr:S24/S26 family peptidase [Bacillota bacterium]
MSGAVSFHDVLKEKKMTDGKYELSLAEFVRPFAANGQEISVSGRGTSMLPTINEDCSLVMAPLPPDGARAGDVLLYARANGQSVIHRVWRVSARAYDMMGDNQVVIERNVPKTAAVARVKTILYPDGTQAPGRKGICAVRLRHARRCLRRLAGRIYRKIVRK